MDPLTLPIHPRTGLRAAGIVNGRPVWPILGGAPEDGDPPAGGEPTGDQGGDSGTGGGGQGEGNGQPPASEPPASTTPPDPASGGGDGEEPKDVKEARKQAATYRTRLRSEEEARTAAEKERDALKGRAAEADDLRKILDGLNQVLNPKAKDEPVDPEKLVAQLAEERKAREDSDAKSEAKIRDLTIKAELPAIFQDLQADPDLTMAVLTSSGALSKLDTSKRSFAADLKSVISEAMDKNPKLKAAPAAVRSGTEPTGKSGETDQLTHEQVKAMTPEQITAAQKAGRLKKLLGG
jgi:hypothetical protein